MNRVTLVILIWIQVTHSYFVRREITDDYIVIVPEHSNSFPYYLPVVLKAANRTVEFNFTKQDVDFNIPIYSKTKDERRLFVLDTPPIQKIGFYEDPRFDASVTLHCLQDNPLYLKTGTCTTKIMSGLFYIDGQKYVIEPKTKKTKRSETCLEKNITVDFIRHHQVVKIHEADFRCNSREILNFEIKKNLSTEFERRNLKRYKKDKERYIIELMVMFTHTVPMRQVEIYKQKVYYIHVLWGVNKLLNNIKEADVSLGLHLIGFIMERPFSSIFKFSEEKENPNYIIKHKTVLALSEVKQQLDCDHLTLFTDYQLGRDYHTVGYAPVGSMCGKRSVSIIKNTGNFQEIFTVMHELGHSLGMVHDGKRNKCSPDDHYIMSPRLRISRRKSMILHLFRYSPCSLEALKKFMDEFYGSNCLADTRKRGLVPKIPTGQLYPIQDQCKLRSSKKGICWFLTSKYSHSFCLFLWCDIGNKKCTLIVPAYKTTCGNRKWCVSGECVYDKDAPLADETCLYGDNPHIGYILKLKNGTKIKPKHCEDFIKLKPDFCTNRFLKKKCCDTCFNLEHPGNKRAFENDILTNVPPSGCTSCHFDLKFQILLFSMMVFHLIQMANCLAA